MAMKRKGVLKHRRQVATIDEATIRLHLEPLEDGGYVATSPDVPGLVAEGRSVMEAVEIAQGLTRKIVESCLDHGDPIPPALANLKHTKLDFLVPVGYPLMGRLSGFKYCEVARRLRAFGFVFDRVGAGSHELWHHAVTGRKVTIPHHAREMAEGTSRDITPGGN